MDAVNVPDLVMQEAVGFGGGAPSKAPLAGGFSILAEAFFGQCVLVWFV